MRDETALRRQWALLRALSTRRFGLCIREMTELTGVKDKTIRRDLALFRAVGFPVVEDVGDFGRKTWRIVAGRDLPPLGFSFDESVALYLGRRRLDLLAGSPFAEAGASAFEKIRAAFSPAALAYIRQFERLFHDTGFGGHDYGTRSNEIDGIRSAIEDGVAARLRYRSDSEAEARERMVHPYGLVIHRAALYLVAHDPAAERIKHYKVDRIEAVEVTGDAFSRPPDFDLSTHLERSFGIYHHVGDPITVRIRFVPEVSRYVRETRWQKDQRLIDQPDGGVVAEFRVSCTQEIKSWTLGFGRKAVVLEPESLGREIADELEAMLTAYRETSVAPS